MIRLENITKIYNEKVDDTKALDDVSLKIEDGEFVAVMGASGSGKSTLLKIIGCMDTPTAGKYFLDNTEVTVASRSQVHKLRKEKIGYVFQHFALMDYYTAYENIELPLLAANVKRKERKRIILKTDGTSWNIIGKKQASGKDVRRTAAESCDSKSIGY